MRSKLVNLAANPTTNYNRRNQVIIAIALFNYEAVFFFGSFVQRMEIGLNFDWSIFRVSADWLSVFVYSI